MDAKTSKPSSPKAKKSKKKSAKSERSKSERSKTSAAKKDRTPRVEEPAEREPKAAARAKAETVDDREEPHGHGHDEGHAHVMPVKTLLGVWGGLMVLTVLTVAIAQVHLGQLNVVVALAVAVVKATLVALYFMHLKYDTPANRVVLVSAAFFLILFVSFVVFDTTQYQHDLIKQAVEAAE